MATSISPHSDPAVLAVLATLGSENLETLTIGGIPARDLARQFGTPLYVFDQRAILAHVDAVRAALGSEIELLWSIKANPSVAITALLREHGVAPEIASLGELEVASMAQHEPHTVRFAGPGKTEEDLRVAIERSVILHAESLSEVTAAGRIAQQLDTTATVALRVNLPGSLRGARLRMSGESSRFGIDRQQVADIARQVLEHPRLELRGLHVYGGTQCFSAAAFSNQARAICELADELEAELDTEIRELDLGGGFGVATFCGDEAFDLAAAGAQLHEVLAAYRRPYRSFYVELGRYLTAHAGVYLAKVVRRKVSGDRVQIALDGGMHQAAVGAGLGSLMRRPPMLIHAERLLASPDETVTVGGPLCTPQDRFADGVLLPTCNEGDLCAMLATGAYGLTFSPVRFLSHAEPAEVLVADGKARIVRDRGTPSDAVRGQRP